MHFLKVGDSLPVFKLPPITRKQLFDYSQASGDPNKIHLDDEVAKQVGLPGVIAHGMLIASFLVERAMSFMAEADIQGKWRLENSHTRFKGMTFPGDVISVHGTVKQAEIGRVVLDLKAENPKGEATVIGTATFIKSMP